MRDVGDLLGDLVRTDEEVGVILGELADAEEPVEGALEFVTVVEAGLGELERQVAIGAGLGLVDEAGTRAVHGLDGEVLVINLGRVHVLLVVVPVTRGLPKRAREDNGGLHLVIAVLRLHVVPVVHERIADDHAVGQPEWEARTGVRHHEELHLATDLAVVAALCLGEKLEVLVEVLLRGEGDAVDAREHLVVLVAPPVGARDARELEGLERLGVGEVRTDAHVDVLALLVEGDARVLGEVADVLDLVLLATLAHVLDGLGAGKLVGLELEVLLADLLHLGLDRGEVLLADLRVLGQVDVVVEAVLGGRAECEVSSGIETLDGLGHDVRSRVTDDVQLLVGGALAHVSVVVENLHLDTFPPGSDVS